MGQRRYSDLADYSRMIEMWRVIKRTPSKDPVERRALGRQQGDLQKIIPGEGFDRIVGLEYVREERKDAIFHDGEGKPIQGKQIHHNEESQRRKRILEGN